MHLLLTVRLEGFISLYKKVIDMKFVLFILFSLSFLTGCIYKMPTKNNICTSPNTNNPLYTREQATSLQGKKI